MKVYVDELPKSCGQCPCCVNDTEYGYYCNLQDLDIQTNFDRITGKYDCDRKRHENCPLQPLSDYTKQVRKEVVQDIRKYGAINYPYNPVTDSPRAIFMIALENLERIEQRLTNKTKDMPVMKVAHLINSVLDQIGETK